MTEDTRDATEQMETTVPEDRVLRTSQLRTGGRRPKGVYDAIALLRRLEKEYDLGPWDTWRRADQGASNDSWFVETASGDVVVRRSHDLKTAEGLRFEQALIAYLRAQGYPAPVIVPTRTGALSVTLDGVHHMVAEQLPGTTYRWTSPDRLPTAAQGLGWFHRLVDDLPADQTAEQSSSLTMINATAQERLLLALSIMEPLLPPDERAGAEQDIRWLSSEMLVVHDELAARLPELTYLITHGSYGPTAVLLEDDHLSGVLDFDRAAHDLLTLDLATAVWVFCSASPFRRRVLGLDLGRLTWFLQEYATEYKASAADLTMLATALRARRLLTVSKKCENFLTKSAIFPGEAGRAEKLTRTAKTEATQCRWLKQHESDLTRAAHPCP
jgi:Ser/Thr protein kinase RdoA (MazF antagonist)